MREIKFRAWNKETKKMIDLKSITPLALDIDPSSVGAGIGIYVPEHARLIIEQFTGLKDKNGKDLDWWENDSLRKGSDHNYAPIGIITYNEQKASWVIVSKSGGEFCGLVQAYKNGWVKIGNIHENPEN